MAAILNSSNSAKEAFICSGFYIDFLFEFNGKLDAVVLEEVTIGIDCNKSIINNSMIKTKGVKKKKMINNNNNSDLSTT